MRYPITTLKWALAIYCQDYHSGQFSREYRYLSRCRARNLPSCEQVLADDSWADIRDCLSDIIESRENR